MTNTTPETSTVRLDADSLAQHMSAAMESLEHASRESSLDESLQEMVRLRASQINGCVYCVNLHNRAAKKAGEDERKVWALPVWRESPLFDAREKAALEITEAMTRLADNEITDEQFARVSKHFTDTELAELLWVVAVINAWNRIGAAARPWPLT